MDTTKILHATKAMQEHELALAWLSEHGHLLTESDAVSLRVEIRGKELGHMAAASALADLALASIPSLVPMAIENCRRALANEKAIIQRELMEVIG